MGRLARASALCLLCWFAALGCLPAIALGESSPSGEGVGGSSSLGGALVTPGSPVQGEQAQAAEEAKLANPNAVAEREASGTKFEGLSTEQAIKVAGEVFPMLVEEPAGGPPKLPAGESVEAYLSGDAARVGLGGGKSALLESMTPIAVAAGAGSVVPIDLSLREAGSGFAPKTPAVAVSIPKQLSNGVSLSGVGISLTAVDEHGAALEGSKGAIDGVSVFYANTQTDTDTLAKPTTGGFELDSVLRSVNSPGQLHFRVGMPAGALLVQESSGNVSVVDEGAVLARVLAPAARDAEGASVAVSMTVAGDVLTLGVDDGSGEHAWPIVVDPTVEEGQFLNETRNGKFYHTEWHFEHSGSAFSAPAQPEGESWTETIAGSHTGGEWGGLFYTTRGESQIIRAKVEGHWDDVGSNIQNYMLLATSAGRESYSALPVNTEGNERGGTVCAPELKCSETTTAGEAKNNNTAAYDQEATGAGNGVGGSNTLLRGSVEVSQEKGPELSFNTTSKEIDGQPNAIYKEQPGWLGPNSGAFEVVAKDPGVGISEFGTFGHDAEGAWGEEHFYYREGECTGVQCPEQVHEVYSYKSTMPNGEEKLETTAHDAVGLAANVSSQTIKVDGTPPHGIVLSGLPSSGVINEAQYHLQAPATDGSGKTPSSGVKSIALYLDGYEVAGKSGSCAPGPCTAVGEWTINGETFGAGKHTLTVQATDNAGNVETKPYPITVRHAGSLGVGPGSVDPITGALHLSASDVSLSGGRGTLGFSRSYDSRQLKAGEQGPLGPQWSSSISGSQRVEREPSGSVVLAGSGGGLTTFESNGKGGYVSPKGDENLVLEAEKEGEKIKAYLLKDPAAGTTVRYTQPGGAGPWVLASSEGALSSSNGEKQTVEWERIENVTRPKLALAPAPKGVTCSPTVKEPKELSKGCRALSFTYATETTATGEAPGEWKAYKGRLMKVSFTAYNPSTKAIETTPVAEYVYDKQGRLRAEWDPRIEPSPLKTTYGYDSEGHVTSVNPAGQEPWLLHYGTTASDTSAGRLLSVTRPPAGTATQVKEQDEKAAPVNEAAPTLSSTSPVIGTTLNISSNGTWSNSPLTYSDDWEDCYTYESKETCTAIPGAVNGSYTPQARDAGYTLKAQVTAVNADGATVVTTAASKVLAGVAPAYKSQFGKAGEAEGQFKGPAGDAIDPSGDVWVADSSNSRVQELSASGTFMKAVGWGVSNGKAEFEICTSACKVGIAGSGAGQFSKPEGIAINQATKNVYVVDKGNNRVEEFSAEGKYVGAFGEKGSEPGELSAPVGLAVAPNGNVWVGDYGNNRVDEFTEAGGYLGSFGKEGSENGQFKGPTGIAFSGEDAYVVDSGNDRVQELSMSGEFIRKFGSKGTAEGQFEAPYGIGAEPVSGDLYVADTDNNRIEEFSPAGTFLVAYGKKGEKEGEFASPQAVTGNSTGYVYVADSANNRVQELEPKYSKNNPLPEPPALGTSAVTTIDYNVPLWGEGAPDTTAKNEAEEKAERETWGQTDDPAEPMPGESLATAVFPPDEPMGWPAKNYKRATITYLDEVGRTVNRASPSGGISTSEYNEDNEAIRSLSAADRVAALKETNSTEASELLDTKSKYNGETKEEKEKEEKAQKETGRPVEPGTRLLEVRGPQHTVKLSSGGEVKARNHVKYYYDEGAPENETYDLVTKTTDGAEYEGKEADVRTTTTSYSGQGGLGWLLRKPTSITTEPSSGVKLVNTTFYDPGTGNVTETRAPAEGGNQAGAYAYSSQLSKLTETCTPVVMKNPSGVVVDSAGRVWIADTGNSRVDEFSSTGEYINAFGTEGSAEGQFKKPQGIAVDSKGDIWVADTGNDRVEELSSTGTFIRAFGEEGTGTGQFIEPTALAIDSSGNVWVADTANKRVEEFSSTGTYLREFVGNSAKANGIAADAKGDVWVAQTGVYRVVELSPEAKEIGSFGSLGSGNGQFLAPEGIVIAGETAYVVDTGNNRVEQFKLTEKEGKGSGEYVAQFGTKGTGNGQFEGPRGMALDKEGNLWIADTGNNRIQEFTSARKYVRQLSKLTETCTPVVMKNPSGVVGGSAGRVWIADTGNSRVDEFSSTGEYINAFGTEGSAEGQFKKPQGIAVDSKGDIWVADTGNDRVEELSSTGTFIRAFGEEGTGTGQFIEPTALAIDSSGNVWVADTANKRVEEFSSTGTYLREFVGNSAKANGIAADAKGDVWVAQTGVYRVVELSPEAKEIGSFGSLGSGNGQFLAPEGIVIAGETAYVVDTGNNRVEQFKLTEKEGKGSGEYVAQFGTKGTGNGQFEGPRGMALDKEGNLWIADTGNNRIQEFSRPNPGGSHAAQTIYYTTAANPTYKECGEHPEWANLPCRSQPTTQPTKGLPLPIITDKTYNVWDEPETVTEEFGPKTREKKLAYDKAGRLNTNEETSTIDSALPKVADEYSPETGAMVKQSTTVGETTKSIKSVYNTLGQLTEYTDADGNTTQYVYSGPANDGQVEEVSYGGKKGSQVYSYDPTTEALTKLLDVGPEGGAGAGTFTASYDVEGTMTSESYPNGMTAKYTFNPVSEATSLEYEKATHCAGTCPEAWFKEAVVPSIHGEALARTSTLAKEEYTYDNAGRLTQVNETPTGKGCKTRIYAYNEDSDRTSETTRASSTETCATTGGTTESHTYDEADRLIDTGVEYETFGNQTKIPAADAGEHEIAASFYLDNQVATQKQNGETTNYSYDPAGRTEKTVSEGTTKATIVNHYPGPGEAISWACEEAAKECEEGKGTKWTRNIAGIDGTLSATQHNSEAAILQLHDLEGDVVATAAVSETETKLLTTYNPTEFGVPVNGTPPTKFSWLGASGLATEQATGAANPSGSSYVPQLGAPLQTEPINPPGILSGSTSEAGIVLATYTVGGLLKNVAVEHQASLEAAAATESAERNPACPASECHVDGPGEGNCEANCEEEGAEEYDPEGLASYKTTIKRAEELRRDGVTGALVGLAADLGIPGAADGGGAYDAVLEASAYDLELCVSTGKALGRKSGSWGTCFINELRAEALGISIPISATAELCEYVGTRQWGKKPHNMYYCVDAKVDRWGPWF